MGESPTPGDRSRSEPSLKPGTVVSHYRIDCHLGTGGMGEVYAADDVSLKRKVALKIVLPDIASDALLRRRFEREADSLASINHPNVETIHEIGIHQDRPYFTAEYIEGQSLRERIDEGPLSVDAIIDLATQICSGLTAIHETGLIHRDIKPSNILIDTAGRVRIVDFGIAHAPGDPDSTDLSATIGTIGYMSPEQIRGESLSPASDLFSLGVVLYEAASGKRPFAGEYEASIQYAIVHEDAEPIVSHRNDLPDWLASLISTLLDKRPARRYESADAVCDILTAHGGGAAEQPPPAESERDERRSRSWTVPVMLLAIVMISVLAVIFLPRGADKTSSTSLAVLPFRNLGSPEDEYFADGMTDAVITRLAGLKSLRVISRQSSMQYKDSDLGFRAIADELGVGYILTGTIYWDKSVEPDEIRINAQLVRSEDESYVWGEEYSRIRRKVISLQSDIAEQVTAVLKIALSEADRMSILAVPTASLEAYDYFLRGNHYFNRSWNRSDIHNATEMFQRAAEADTGFALAYAMLSRGHESMFWEYYDRSEDRCRLARRAANRALALQPNLTEGHLARGYIFYHCGQDYENALEEFRAALTGNPNHADLYSAIAAVQRRQGKLDEAVDDFTTAFSLDPRSHLKAFDVALTYGLTRRFDEADRYLDKALTLAPDWPLPYIYTAWTHIFRAGDTAAANDALTRAAGRADITTSQYYWWISRIVQPDYEGALNSSRPGSDTAGHLLHQARLYRLMSRNEDEYRCADSARYILETRLTERPDDPRFHSQLGLAYAGLRRRADAIEHGQKALELLPASRDAFDPLFFMVNLAEILVIFEENDAAIDQLERLMSIPGFISGPYLRVDPLWIPLRSHPRFQKLLESA